MIYDKAINLYAKRRGDQRESYPIMNSEAAWRLHFLYLVSQQGKNLSLKWKKIKQAPRTESSSTLELSYYGNGSAAAQLLLLFLLLRQLCKCTWEIATKCVRLAEEAHSLRCPISTEWKSKFVWLNMWFAIFCFPWKQSWSSRERSRILPALLCLRKVHSST